MIACVYMIVEFNNSCLIMYLLDKNKLRELVKRNVIAAHTHHPARQQEAVDVGVVGLMCVAGVTLEGGLRGRGQIFSAEYF